MFAKRGTTFHESDIRVNGALDTMERLAARARRVAPPLTTAMRRGGAFQLRRDRFVSQTFNLPPAPPTAENAEAALIRPALATVIGLLASICIESTPATPVGLGCHVTLGPRGHSRLPPRVRARRVSGHSDGLGGAVCKTDAPMRCQGALFSFIWGSTGCGFAEGRTRHGWAARCGEQALIRSRGQQAGERVPGGRRIGLRPALEVRQSAQGPGRPGKLRVSRRRGAGGRPCARRNASGSG